MLLDHLKKWWPTHVTWLGAAANFFDPSIKAEISRHPAIAVGALAAWAIVLHNLTAPKNADVVADSKIKV